ncbi:2-oxo-4-hydroxy-4-carboxy-5-ureidoimidazoline decarboxylase [Nocardioides sp. zg-DK7169]|uniref:2-oxo-4-hydroxy-4-carboxy-5-ureidoimidazoline decarboxylase n=1 Tax=Nocardioides sp. zg-DK7169 TaxID=2736600 RepID=UPI001557E2A0|nr:2-oxo-4-hydroxy-4-carboxy-5-ureidoimidazoline decarboxylase [Nocardioides sp. zg-DK7169]
MRIEDFNAMDAAGAADVLRPCAAIPRWVEALVAGRPYADADALLARAEALAVGWTGAEVEQALADHPRIGERHAGDGTSAAMSRSEQSGVSPEAALQARIAAGNAAYEQRFGRVFLIRAAGRSGEEILAQLDQRLTHDPTTELEVTRGQLAEIAALRLRGILR